jgi:trehalose 2-sulfotransferase
VTNEGHTPSRGYLMCCIERTGSSLLAAALGATGVAGRPREYFNPVNRDKELLQEVFGGTPVIEGVSKILTAATTPNGVFGAKLHWNHLQYLAEVVRAESSCSRKKVNHETPNLSSSAALLPVATVRESLRARSVDSNSLADVYKLFNTKLRDVRVIWMTRRNMVARAVSHFRARRSGVWYQSLRSAKETPSSRPHGFDAAEIHEFYCVGGFQEECWLRFFQQQGIIPFQVVYEEFVANYEATIRQVLAFLELETAFVPSPKSVRQADETSGNWEMRYRQLIAAASLE